MSDMSWDEWHEFCEPLRWQGKHVYIRSIESIGFVSASQQYGGDPELNTITVSLVENGRWSQKSISVKYTMPHAKEDLVPDITYLMAEEVEVTDD